MSADIRNANALFTLGGIKAVTDREMIPNLTDKERVDWVHQMVKGMDAANRESASLHEKAMAKRERRAE